MILTDLLFGKTPVTLIHYVANRCNARCPHCFIQFEDPRFKETFSLEEIRKTAAKMPSTLRNVNLTGGEPFLRNDLFEVAAAYLDRPSIQSLFITTNGFYTDRTLEFLKKIAAAYPQKQVLFGISMDDFATAHDNARGVPGLFERALATYRLVNSHASQFRATALFTLTPENMAQSQAILTHLVEEHGVRSLSCNFLRLKSMSPETHTAYREAYRKVREFLDDGVKTGRLGHEGGGFLGRVWDVKNRIARREIERTDAENRYLTPCRAATLFGVIYPNGDVYPCELLEKPLGNLRQFDYDLGALWKEAPADKARTFIRDTNCFCTFECAWSVNILASPSYWGELCRGALFGGPKKTNV